MQSITPSDVIRVLGLEPLPQEGGFFRVTFRSPEQVETDSGTRPCGSAIYYLITDDDFSALHRLPQTEIFHFYAGDPVEMALIHWDGRSETVRIGSDLTSGARPQVVVPGGTWQGCRMAAGGWALMGCSVVPGYDLKDFELGDREALCRQYPALREVIHRYTRGSK